MQKLLERLESDFDQIDGWIRIVGAEWGTDDLRLDVSIAFHGQVELELWRLVCEGVVEESLCFDGAETLTVSSESPLLKAYTEPVVDIMFSGNSLAPEIFLGIVCSSCVEVIGRPGYISRFVNMEPAISGIVSSRHGLLGSFPESVAKRIIRALRGRPVRTVALPGYMPKHWTGVKYVSYPKLKALEIGKSYVIGERFRSNLV